MASTFNRYVYGSVFENIAITTNPMTHAYDIFIVLDDDNLNPFDKGRPDNNLFTSRLSVYPSNLVYKLSNSSNTESVYQAGLGTIASYDPGAMLVTLNQDNVGSINILSVWDRALGLEEMEQAMKLGDTNVAKGSLVTCIIDGKDVVKKGANYTAIRYINTTTTTVRNYTKSQTKINLLRGLNNKFLVMIAAAGARINKLLFGSM